MGTNGNKLPPPADVLMQFILQVDEGGVGTGGEFDVAQYGAGEKWSDFSCL